MGRSTTALKKYPTIAPCGLECGFCPRFYTVGSSRCPGCAGPNFFLKHPSCSFITCCVKKNHFEVCSECAGFPCAKFKSNEEYQHMKGSPSYPPVRNIISNLIQIRDNGIGKFITRQRARMNLLGLMLADYDDGRSKSYYCRTAALLDSKSLKKAIQQAVRKVKLDKVRPGDIKGKASVLKAILDEESSR